MSHGNLSLDLTGGFKRNAHDNQQRGAAEGQLGEYIGSSCAGPCSYHNDKYGEDGDKGLEDGVYKGNPV